MQKISNLRIIVSAGVNWQIITCNSRLCNYCPYRQLYWAVVSKTPHSRAHKIHSRTKSQYDISSFRRLSSQILQWLWAILWSFFAKENFLRRLVCTIHIQISYSNQRASAHNIYCQFSDSRADIESKTDKQVAWKKLWCSPEEVLLALGYQEIFL
jgi:hypothetical protein